MLNLRRNITCILFIFTIFIKIISITGEVKAENDLFDVYELNVEGDDVDYLVEDLNNDGLNDLLFFHTKGKGKTISRHFSIFYHTVNGFNNKAYQSFEIDPEAVIYDCADVDANPGKEILYFKSNGLFYYEQGVGLYYQQPKLFLKTDSMYSLPDKKYFEHLNFARDLNGDGDDEILVPQFRNCLIYGKGQNGDYELKSRLDVLMQHSIVSSKEVTRYLVSSLVIPNIVIADYNRDQRNDIVIVQDTYIKVFFQDEQGNYSNDNSVFVELGFELTEAYTLKLGNVNRRSRYRLKDKTGIKCLKDMNNDGLLDMVIEKLSFSGGAFNPKKLFPVYFGKEILGDLSRGGTFNKVPDHIIVNRGFQVHSWIIDLNNDEKMDIIIPVVEIGLFNIITMLITGNIGVTNFIYLMDDTGNYAKKPSDVFEFTVEFHRSGRKIPLVDFDGDYNGDGRKDLLRAEGDNLIINYAPESGILSDGPEVMFPLEIPDNGMKAKPRTLNADGKSDVVIIYERMLDENTMRKTNVRILMAK